MFVWCGFIDCAYTVARVLHYKQPEARNIKNMRWYDAGWKKGDRVLVTPQSYTGKVTKRIGKEYVMVQENGTGIVYKEPASVITTLSGDKVNVAYSRPYKGTVQGYDEPGKTVNVLPDGPDAIVRSEKLRSVRPYVFASARHFTAADGMETMKEVQQSAMSFVAANGTILMLLIQELIIYPIEIVAHFALWMASIITAALLGIRIIEYWFIVIISAVALTEIITFLCHHINLFFFGTII